jgi:hypothetical protein
MPYEICACDPEMIRQSNFRHAYKVVEETLSEALADGTLQYDVALLQFTGETMETLKNKLSSKPEIEPADLWYKISGNTVTDFLYKTHRTVKYIQIIKINQTIYLLNNSDNVSRSRPSGW